MRYKNNVAAFFDVDDTLINVKSMFSFLGFLKRNYALSLCNNFYTTDETLSEVLKSELARIEINRLYYTLFQGLTVSFIERVGREWFDYHVKQDNFFIEPTNSYLKEHQKDGYSIHFVSGSFNVLLDPIANYLGVSSVLCNELEVVKGKYTGKLIQGPTIGEGKTERILMCAEDQQIELSRSYAYGDDISDLPMLSVVGFPRLVNPSTEMINTFYGMQNSSAELLVAGVQ